MVIEDPPSPVKRQNTYYVQMSLFDTFYEDYINFQSYIRNSLDARYTNVAAENKLVSDEKESYFWTTKLATEKKKINALSKDNEYLKVEIESYQKVIRPMVSEISNQIDNNVWNTVLNKSQRIRKKLS